MRERLLFGLAVCGLLVAGAVAAANIDLVDAEQVSAAVDAPDQVLPVAQVADTVPLVVDDAPCKYPDNCEPETVTLFINLTIDGMLTGDVVFAFDWSCSGVTGMLEIDRAQLFDEGGQVRVGAETRVPANGSCDVTMTPSVVFQPVQRVAAANGADIEVSFVIEAG